MIGVARIFRSLSRLIDDRAEVDTYIETFTRYMNSHGHDGEAYGELIERSIRVQKPKR